MKQNKKKVLHNTWFFVNLFDFFFTTLLFFAVHNDDFVQHN
jgi:hypothetical protein